MRSASGLATTVTAAMLPHSSAIFRPLEPLLFSAAVEPRPSGKLLIAIAATIGMLMPPCSTDSPITIDSGMPSISAPIAIAAPVPPASVARRATMFAGNDDGDTFGRDTSQSATM